MVHKKVLIVLISLTVTLTLIFQIKQYFFPNYDYYVLSKLKETEQEFLKNFILKDMYLKENYLILNMNIFIQLMIIKL